MKNRRWLCGALLAASVLAMMPAAAKGIELPEWSNGSMMVYDFDKEEPAIWPDSLEVKYCVYVARHGARYMSGKKKIERIRKVLVDAENGGYITEEGRKFLALVDSIEELSEGKWGSLSSVGLEEERELGKRMMELFPALKRGEGRVDGCATYVPRAQMTMYSFSRGMAGENDSLEFNLSAGPDYSRLLYSFAVYKPYADYRKDGAWMEIEKEMMRKHVSERPLWRLIGRRNEIDGKESRELVMEMYSLLQSLTAMGLPQPDEEWMTAEEYEGCWRVVNLTHYLRNSVNPHISTALARATGPLLRRIVNDIDSAARGENKALISGYFGHAETLLPLLSVMRLPGCYALPLDYEELSKEWRIEDITPLGANLAIFLLESKEGRQYAAVRLNGRNVVPLSGYPRIMEWTTLRDYWLHILNALELRTRS